MRFPTQLDGLLLDAEVEEDTMGRSGDAVFRARKSGETLYIKSGCGEGILRERDVLLWLEGKLPAPRILGECAQEERHFLVLSEIAGDMACDPARLTRPEETVRLLAQGFAMLWSVPVAGCPFDESTTQKLKRARRHLPSVDAEEVRRTTGFSSPGELLAWLEENAAQDDPVFSHGDFCLPNIILGDGAVSGFIDWGLGGVADRYDDIDKCLWSMQHNFKTDAYGDLLFNLLETPIDKEKLRYRGLLDILLP